LEVKRIDDLGLLIADFPNQQSAINNQQSLLVSVSDTGLGIPLSEQDLIFDEFRQSERTSARGYGGLGLGLAICKRLVELHRGRIGVQSSGAEGAGSTFYFTLPIMGSEIPSASSSFTSRTVLVLSERPDQGNYLSEHLRQQGFEVVEYPVEGTRDWLPQLLTSPPGALVLDPGLASEHGWEVLKVLKGNSATRDIPILFYSLTQKHNAGFMLEMDYLTKPLGATDLAQALARQGWSGSEKSEAKTILVVDDDPGILETQARMVQLQSEAYRVLKARNGREALALLQQTPPDLVLLDLMMPELDGFGVLEAMRERETTRDIPVIVLTSQVLRDADMARLNRGVATVLNKGLFSVQETLTHIETALARRRQLGSKAQRLVRKAMAYLHEHYAEPLARETIADALGVSPGYLDLCFRQEMNLTLITYLNRYRVNQAKALLTTSELSLTEIALAVGFADSAHFSHAFRREVGQSPSAYRRGR
jgi:DNA-binding response OmpR family regulator